MSLNESYCIILAGGKGRRLWPSSREGRPKQFIDFFGLGRTQLQQTFDRFNKIVPTDHIYVSTIAEYVDLVKEQLPGLQAENLLSEPISRNTAPSALWASHRIARITPEANIIVVPSDQTVQNEELYRKDILEGLEIIEKHDLVLAMGVTPTRPEPGYGYIQMGESLTSDVFMVKSFTEKPERDFAKMFIDSGEFLWNTGMFLARASVFKKTCEHQLPVVLRQLEADNPHYTIDEENEYINNNYSLYPNISIDFCILEKSEQVAVMKCDFGWADLGTWHSVYEAQQKSPDDNVLIDTKAMIEDSHGNVIKLPEGRLAVINGLEGFIVAEQGNVLFICKKEDSSALIKKYVNEIIITKGDEFV